MNRRIVTSMIVVLIGVVLFGRVRGIAAGEQARLEAQRNGLISSPLYLLTYDHGGLVLWGQKHFVRHLRGAIDWLDRYSSFKIGLDNEAYTYDQLAKGPNLAEPPWTIGY